jgi:hypothetical protein
MRNIAKGAEDSRRTQRKEARLAKNAEVAEIIFSAFRVCCEPQYLKSREAAHLYVLSLPRIYVFKEIKNHPLGVVLLLRLICQR